MESWREEEWSAKSIFPFVPSPMGPRACRDPFSKPEKRPVPLQAPLKFKILKAGEIYVVISGEKRHNFFNGIPTRP